MRRFLGLVLLGLLLAGCRVELMPIHMQFGPSLKEDNRPTELDASATPDSRPAVDPGTRPRTAREMSDEIIRRYLKGEK